MGSAFVNEMPFIICMNFRDLHDFRESPVICMNFHRIEPYDDTFLNHCGSKVVARTKKGWKPARPFLE